MIRIVTRKRLALLEADTHAAFERARRAGEARDRSARELADAIDRTGRAEATTDELSFLLGHAVKEASTAEQRVLLGQIELRRLREELADAREPGRAVFVLLHYGTPRMVYRSREDACADTATHGVRADAVWRPAERFWADAEWLLAVFRYDAGARGFRGTLGAVPEALGGAA
ncbi:hypothetical protein G3I40_39230 [Streptomyces sp. SID14478]|uniref:hypothetical protein n=1 Tax=Streptomyces sp. SID14478 TaxID=2706073 RepID=UPI0013DFE2E7|nr:hypothetical protein [Streptomyces sp. SID14478]NEB81199.1 hypothetical protein [Streptomyces sp. SID14478]